MKNQIDLYFAKYIYKKSDGCPEKAFALLVHAIGCGNAEYIKDLCVDLGHPKDMYKTAMKLIAKAKSEV